MQSTSIMGTAGWVTPRAQTASGPSSGRSSSSQGGSGGAASAAAGGGTWASRLKAGPRQVPAPVSAPARPTSSFETLRKRDPDAARKEDKKNEPEVDYFELTS